MAHTLLDLMYPVDFINDMNLESPCDIWEGDLVEHQNTKMLESLCMTDCLVYLCE